MDTMYQRGKIQHAGDIVTEIELIRSTPEEKGQQFANVGPPHHPPANRP